MYLMSQAALLVPQNRSHFPLLITLCLQGLLSAVYIFSTLRLWPMYNRAQAV